jgi:hypothetical protein
MQTVSGSEAEDAAVVGDCFFCSSMASLILRPDTSPENTAAAPIRRLGENFILDNSFFEE